MIWNFRLMSIAFTECVSAPIEIRSTPVAATSSRLFSPILPEASVMALPSIIFTAFMTGIYVATLGYKGQGILKAGLSLLLGGAYSNTYDRLRRKYVVDYISFGVKGKLKNIIFNISDFGIILGAGLMVIGELLKE